MIEQFTTNTTNYKDYVSDLKTQSAVERQLGIIGEAVKNLPVEFTKKYPKIPWNKIARMRDKLIHKYFGVDLDLTFDVIKKDLLKLKEDIIKILEKEEN